jgi:hypothetical protein
VSVASFAAGAHDGTLTFEAESTTDEDTFFALIGIPLSATVIEP